MKKHALIIALTVLAVFAATTADVSAQDRRGRGNRDGDRDRAERRKVEVEVKVGNRDRGHRPPVFVQPVSRRSGHASRVVRRSGHASRVVRHRPRRHGIFRHRRFIPGRWDVQRYQVWVPGRYRYETVAPVYRDSYDRYGRCFQVLVRAGYTRSIWEPAHYETQVRRVWISGRWVFGRY